jgi:hypothetical protein
MSKTLAELIADAAADDNMEFTTADGTKVKLADIRGFRGVVETERQAAERGRKEAERLAIEAKNIFDSVKAAQDEMNKNREPERQQKKSRWQDNPLYDELVPEIEALQKIANEASAQTKALKESLDKSQATYAYERLRREWAEAGVKPQGKKFEEAVQEVLAAKELDELGMPTLSRWLNRATEPDRIKKATDEAVAAARKEWEKQQRVADIPKPGKFQTRKSADAPIKKLDELTSDLVGNDPDIIAAMEGPAH